MIRHLVGGKGYPRVRKMSLFFDSFCTNTSENCHFNEHLLVRSLFSVSSLKCHQNRTFQHPSSLYYKMFHNFFRSYRLSIQCKFEKPIISTLLRECCKTEAFHRVSVLVRGVAETETSCLHTVGETT